MGQRRSRRPSGAHGVRRHATATAASRGQQWRYNTLFRTQDGALSNTISVPNGVVSNQYSGSPMWAPGLSKQIINSTKWAPIGDGNHSHRRRRRRAKPVPQLHVHQELGRQRRMDDELLGDRRVARQRRALGRLSRLRPRGPTGRHPRGQIRSGNENFQQGAFLKPGPGDPYIYSFGTPSGRSGSAFVARVLPAMCRTSGGTNTGTPTAIRGFRAIRGPRRR